MSASKTLKKNLSIAVAAVFLAVAAFACGAFEPAKAYADDTASHLTVASEVHVLVDGEGNVTIPNATVTNDGTCAAYIMGCSSPDGLDWTCDAVGKRIEAGQSITATWRSAGPVSAEIAAQLGEEPYYAGNLTYTYTDGDLKGTVSLDNTDPTVGDTITATVSDANVPDDKLTYQWVKVKDGSETSIDGATGPTYTATDDDAGYELVCKVSSTDDIYQGTISGNTGAVKKVQAFAVYSADDGSLNFYKRAGMPNAGEQFNGKTATAVYTGIEDTNVPLPWNEYKAGIKSATVVDGGIQPKSTAFWFYSFINMTQCDLSKLDVSQTTNMSAMFLGCESLTDLSSLAGWDTSQVTNMSNMFASLSHITDLSSISGWNTSSVTYMNGTFAGLTTPIALDLSNWDTSKVTNMNGMFSSSSGISSVGDLSRWNTGKVTNMDSMFFGCSALTSLNLSGWDTSQVTNTSSMFSFCNKLQEVTLGDKWQWVGTDGYLPTPDSQYITGADGKWYADSNGAAYAPSDVPALKADTYRTAPPAPKAFAVYSADDNSLDFYKRVRVPSDGEQFNGKTATAVYTGIENADSGFWLNTQPWHANQANIKTVTVIDDGIQPKSMYMWFDGFENMTQCDVSKLDTSHTTDMADMFAYCSSLTTVGDLSGWDTSNVSSMGAMFVDCSSLTTVGDLSGWDTSNVTNMHNMFLDCTNLTNLSCIADWNTGKVTDMFGMFKGSYGSDMNITSLDLANWNVSQVTDMREMFFNCRSLTTVGDLSNWNTDKVTLMAGMFSGCSSLTTVGDLSGWDTSNVTNMHGMFSGCRSLTTVGNLSNWNTSNATCTDWMFNSCSSLTSLDLSGWDTCSVADMEYMFNSCSSLTSLDLSSWDTSNVTDMRQMFGSCYKLQVVTLGNKWQWIGTECHLPMQNSNYIPGADGKWYADSDGTGYAPSDVPALKADTYRAVPQTKSAFAVYSADDGSLNFYKRDSLPNAGEQFNGKTATAVYTGIEDTGRLQPWSSYIHNIKSATVVDEGIQPKSTSTWFSNCTSITQCDLTKLDTSSIADFGYMFFSCSNLTDLSYLSTWDTCSVANMEYMFAGCSKLTTVGNLSGWNTKSTTNMSVMFLNCSSLTSLNLTNWDTSSVANMDMMFAGCSSLSSVGNLSGWNTESVTTMMGMFMNCSSLQNDCSNWNVANVTNYNRFNTNAPGVILPLAWQTASSADTSGSNAIVLNAPEDEQRDNGSNVVAGNEDAGDDVDEKLDDSGKEEGLQGSADSNDTVAIGGAKQETGSGQEVYIAA